MTLVRVHRAAQITPPRDIREADRPEEGDHLEAAVTETGAILLEPVSTAGREPIPEQEAETLGAVDEARALHAAKRRR
jgi:bifunctional DNA-binding transcriptional regulator/antitoxin component of YhaV-PrlF toxin-antitoxin module